MLNIFVKYSVYLFNFICIRIWYDMTWCNTILYGKIWYDKLVAQSIWYDEIWYDKIYDKIWYDKIWYGRLVAKNTIWQNMIW